MYRLMKAKADMRQASERIASRIGQRDLLLEQRTSALERKEKAEAELANYDLVQILLQKTSDFARQQAKSQIEEIVTSALSVVFGKDYRFTVVIEVKANQPVAEYWLESEGVQTQLKPPDYDRGGGVADVVSLALRLAVGELSGVRGPLFLDEVGKHVSQEYAPNVAFFLKEYSQKFNRQIVLITHNAHLAEIGDVAVGVTQKAGKSHIQTL
ncbi:chromosome partitioning protein ParA [Sutcliffiella horikoshii]|uniref:Nuclease SbcCD subunit C n=1 Tax=Sutcliffiella horikoshii TaxID=79883 RepID=A0A5D4SFE1_9BACI|nr:chromosome partitioning protein ParA [Sutcliffiella horikoshii]TYS60516.1 chromosome partitioning protein ParA [Sutcliffiella horikoshii]